MILADDNRLSSLGLLFVLNIRLRYYLFTGLTSFQQLWDIIALKTTILKITLEVRKTMNSSTCPIIGCRNVLGIFSNLAETFRICYIIQMKLSG